MPAIGLAHLKSQAARLIDNFDQPDLFVRQLHEMLDFYTNLTLRPAQAAVRASLPSYRTPKPVMRQIERELEAPADQYPLDAVALTNALWKAGYLETRLLACHLLGSIPPASALPLFSLLSEWILQSKDAAIQQALLTDAFRLLRRENAEVFLLLIEEWLNSTDHRIQVWGLRALLPLINEPGFENLPAIFRLLRPTLESASPSTQLDLLSCLRALERVSLTETLHFLREVSSTSQNPQMIRILRRMLPSLPLELQEGLRETLRVPAKIY
ncbi:MAG: DNA alkylation repair protein [Anaerolineales bacterium]|nr:DNA alkylation repair protein [Anaerolineales bacterium]